MLVHITDLHIREPGQLAYGRIDTSLYLQRTVQAILRLAQTPDAVVASGDLTDYGRPAEYAHLAALLAPLADAGIPLYLMPGNHDDRDALRRAFPSHAYLGHGGFVQYSVRVGPLRLLALDTVVPRAPHGALCGERLGWLAAQLDASGNEPVVVAMHHPPFRTLIDAMDGMGLLQGGPELEAIVRQHPNVERVICGHLHRAIDVRFGGTIACTTPAPAHQIALDLAPGAPLRWTLEPSQLRVLAWDGQRVVSHLAGAGGFDGPHAFG